MDFVKNISYSCFLKKYPGPDGISIVALSFICVSSFVMKIKQDIFL